MSCAPGCARPTRRSSSSRPPTASTVRRRCCGGLRRRRGSPRGGGEQARHAAVRLRGRPSPVPAGVRRAQALYLPVHDADKAVVGSMGLLEPADLRLVGRIAGRARPGWRRGGRPSRNVAVTSSRRSSRSPRTTASSTATSRARTVARNRHRGPQGRRRQGDFYPLVPISAGDRSRPREVLEVIEQSSPSPAGRTAPTAYSPSAATLPAVACDPDGPLVAEVVRTTSDPYVGRLSLVRVFSGTLRADDVVHVSGHLGPVRRRRGGARSRGIPTTTTTSASARSARRSATPPVTRTRHRRRAGPRQQAVARRDVGHALGQGPAGPRRAVGTSRPVATRGDPGLQQARRGQARQRAAAGRRRGRDDADGAQP